MAGEFAPSSRPDGPDCTDRAAYGSASTLDQYITKQYLLAEDDYPADACPNRYYSKAKIDDWEVTNEMTGAGDIVMDGEIKSNGGSHTLSNKKNLPFDMPHPNKEGWRLRHVCIEGPEIAVYFRGRVTNKKYIDLPLYWKGLVDWTSITVNLTPIGSHQDVIVKRWDDEKIYLQSNGGMPIDCFYHVTGRRVDDDLIVEYEGESHEDYPGGNEGYSFNFEHNYVKNLIQETVREHLDKES
jgi:hypothetical protein